MANFEISFPMFSTVTGALECMIRLCNSFLKLRSDYCGNILVNYMKIPEKIDVYEGLIQKLKVTKDNNQRVRLYKHIQFTLMSSNDASFATYGQGVTRMILPLGEIKKKLIKIDESGLPDEQIKEKKLNYINKILKTPDGKVIQEFDTKHLTHKSKVQEIMDYMVKIAKILDEKMPPFQKKVLAIVGKKAEREVKQGTQVDDVSDDVKNKLIEVCCNIEINRFKVMTLGPYKLKINEMKQGIKEEYKEYTEQKRGLQKQVVDLDVKLKKMSNKEKSKENELKKLSSKLLKLPSAKRKIGKLEDDLKNLKNEYDKIKLKQNSVIRALKKNKDEHNSSIEKKKTKKCTETINYIDQKMEESSQELFKYTLQQKKILNLNNFSGQLELWCINEGKTKFEKLKKSLETEMNSEFESLVKEINNIK